MKNFSTALLLSAGLASGVAARATSGALPPEFRQAPQARSVAPARDPHSADGWPQVIVLDAHSGPMATVTGGAEAGRMFIPGQVLRLAAPVVGAGRRPVYRPGPWISPVGAAADGGRLAVRVGSVEPVATDRALAIVARSNRELAAGDLVPVGNAPWPAEAALPAQPIAAQVAVQRGDERVRWAGRGQLLAIDRGTQHGVKPGMCIRVGSCGGRHGAIGRVLHAGGAASAAWLSRFAAPLEAADPVCITPCRPDSDEPDDPA